MLQTDTHGVFRGEIRISSDNGPAVENLRVKIFTVGEDGQHNILRELLVSNIGSNNSQKIADIHLQKAPLKLLICLKGKNVKGAKVNREIFLPKDDSSLTENIKDKLVSYHALASADLPKNPNCTKDY